MIKLFCGVYIAVHLAVAALAIRVWPFTDYPMFSTAYYADQSLFVYRYSTIGWDGSQRRLQRSFANGYGIGEPNITALLMEGRTGELNAVLSDWLDQQPDRDQIEAIKISKVEAIRPTSRNEELRIEESDVFIFKRSDLK